MDAAARVFLIPKSNNMQGETHLTLGGVQQVLGGFMAPVRFHRVLERRGEAAPAPDVPPVQR